MRRPSESCCTPLAGSTLDDTSAAELERLLAAIADRHRLRILNMLACAEGQAICVCEFTASLALAQPNVSYHLRQLVDAGLIERERQGRYSYYRLRTGALAHIATLIAGPHDTKRAAA